LIKEGTGASLSDPIYVGVFVAVIFLPLLVQPNCPQNDRRISNWFLVNGFVFHIIDFTAPIMKRPNAIFREYTNADSRYVNPGPDLTTLCYVEILFMCPLSVILFFLFRFRHPYRHLLCIIMSVVHAFGTVMYLSGLALEGFKHVPHFDRYFDFQPNNIIYFWFAIVFCNAVWIIVPVLCAIRSAQYLYPVEVIEEPKKKKELIFSSLSVVS